MPRPNGAPQIHKFGGASLADMGPELAKLFTILAVMLTLAMARFHKRLD